MRKLVNLLDQALVAFAAAALAVMMTMTGLSALGRYFLNRPVPDDVVINQMLMALLVFLPLSHVQKVRQHVSVTLFSDWLPPAGRSRLEVFGRVLSLLFYGLLAATAYAATLKAYKINDIEYGELDLLTWPVHAAMTLGLIGFVLRLLLELARPIFDAGDGQAPSDPA